MVYVSKRFLHCKPVTLYFLGIVIMTVVATSSVSFSLLVELRGHVTMLIRELLILGREGLRVRDFLID